MPLENAVFKINLKLKPHSKATRKRLLIKSNNNINPYVQIQTTSDKKLTEIFKFLAENQLREDIGCLVLHVGASKENDLSNFTYETSQENDFTVFDLIMAEPNLLSQ